MIYQQIDTTRRYSPVPISFLINAAKAFECDIFIKMNDNLINVKRYDEMLCNLITCSKLLLFSFNGSDELAAHQRFEQIFEP